LKLHAALDAEAIKIGYVDFRHLNSCFKDSPELEMGSFPKLPLEDIQSTVMNYQYFLAVGDDAPLTPKDIRAFLDKHVFFWPDYCWYQGKCISLRF